MHFDLLFEWILNWAKVTPPLSGLGLQQRCLILLMMIHVMQNITVKPICPYIGIVVFSIIIKTIPEVSMHLCKFWAKVTPFYSIYPLPGDCHEFVTSLSDGCHEFVTSKK